MSRSLDIEKEISAFVTEKVILAFIEEENKWLEEHKDEIRAFRRKLLSNLKKDKSKCPIRLKLIK